MGQLRTLDIIESWPAHVAIGTPRGTWPCCLCGQDYEVAEGWVVRHRLDDGELVKNIVCPSCAKTGGRPA